MRRTYRLAAPALALAGALVLSGVASACTIDGKATAYVDGRRAARTPLITKPLPASAARTWAMFTFNGRYRAGTALRLMEDRAQLKSALSAQTLSAAKSWRWDFGDGSHASGWAVTHKYTHPGTYRITVAAYYSAWHKYFAFDAIHIVVTR